MFLTVTQAILKGFGTNFYIFIITLLMAIPLGFVITLGSMCRFKPVSAVTKIFVWIIDVYKRQELFRRFFRVCRSADG